jgi:hypothetical protein
MPLDRTRKRFSVLPRRPAFPGSCLHECSIKLASRCALSLRDDPSLRLTVLIVLNGATRLGNAALSTRHRSGRL